MIATAFAVAAAVAGVHMDIGTPLEKAQRDGCAHVAKGIATPGTEGGADNYRGDVDFRAAKIIAGGYKKAHGRPPKLVARTGDTTCSGAVPKLSHKAVTVDAAGVRKKLATALCLEVFNANYEIDRFKVSEWLVRYDAFAKAERAAREKAGRVVAIPTAAAVRKGCTKR